MPNVAKSHHLGVHGADWPGQQRYDILVHRAGGIPLGVDSFEDDDSNGPKAQLNLVLGISHAAMHRQHHHQQHHRGLLWTACIPKCSNKLILQTTVRRLDRFRLTLEATVTIYNPCQHLHSADYSISKYCQPL